MERNQWVKSSFSSASGNNCVEALRSGATGQVFVRNSNDRFSDSVIFTPAEWDAFVKGVKAGEFDLAD